MFNELSKSGTKSSDILKKLTGQSFQEMIASGKSVGDILAIMSDNATVNGQSLADMFGSSEAAKAAMILATDSGNAFNSVLKEMEQSVGATDKAFETIDNTTGNKFKKSLNEVKNSAISMGDILAPVTSKLAEGFSKATKVLSGLSTEQLTMIASIGGGIVTANLALGAFSKLTKGLSKTVEAYKNMKEFGGKAIDIVKNFGTKAMDGAKAAGHLASNLGKSAVEFGKTAVQAGISAVKFVAHKAATIASAIATTTMSAAQAALNFVMSLNPITLIIIGITALVAAIVLLWNKCEWFRNLCMGMFEALKSAWNLMIEFFKSIWQSFVLKWNSAVEGIKNIWNSVCNFFKTIWESIVNSIKSVWEGFKNIFSSIGNSISSIWSGLTNTISSVWNNVVSGVKNAWNGIISPFQNVVNSIKNIWNSIRSMFKLPHFSITGKFSLVPPSIPKVSVDWYYKGGIFKSPTVLGGIGVGDAFNGQGSNAEAIVPLDEMYRNIDNIILNRTNQLINSNNNSNTNPIVVQSILNSKVIAESIAGESDSVNGKRLSLYKRGLTL